MELSLVGWIIQSILKFRADLYSFIHSISFTFRVEFFCRRIFYSFQGRNTHSQLVVVGVDSMDKRSYINWGSCSIFLLLNFSYENSAFSSLSLRSFSIIFERYYLAQISPLKPLKNVIYVAGKVGFLWSMKIEGIPRFHMICMHDEASGLSVYGCEILWIYNKRFSFCSCWSPMLLGWIDVMMMGRRNQKPDEQEKFLLMKLHPPHQWKITT